MTAKCNIIADSPCDFTKVQVQSAGIGCVPFTYTENKPGGGFHGVDDLFESVSSHDFYEMIRRGATPMTSQPSQAVYEEAFRKVQEEGVPTVVICLSTGISGAYNGACAARDRLEEEMGGTLETPIYVVDSKIGSTTEHLYLEEAIRQRDSGLTAEELVAWCEKATYLTHTIFMVDNLDTLHRGGRIPKAASVAANLLDAKPLLTWKTNGELTFLGVSRGRKKAMRKMHEYYKKNHSDEYFGAVVAIGDADCPDDGDALADKLRHDYPGLRVLRSTIGPTIGCHVGPGMLSCCFWGDDRRGARYSEVGQKNIKGFTQNA